MPVSYQEMPARQPWPLQRVLTCSWPVFLYYTEDYPGWFAERDSQEGHSIMRRVSAILFLYVVLLSQITVAHEEPFPGNTSGPRSDQGQENNSQPAAHPGRRILKTGKGRLTGGAAMATGGPFAAHNVELLSQLTLADMGGSGSVKGNDIWGWTDPVYGREYALVGRSDGTAFVDVTSPQAPLYLGFLPSKTGSTAWRDIKVYANHAYIVSDNNGAHGMQVFDLKLLRSVVAPPVAFTETAHYAGFGEGHNIVINEASGYAYAVGTDTFNGGLHFIDLSTPLNPVAANGYSGDGYTHDAQVVTYAGDDAGYSGREIAFCSNEDTLTIVDVTNKSAPVRLSRTGYANAEYTHQGWLTEDHSYFLSNDELDENRNPDINFTRTHIWDVADLDMPVYLGFYEATVQSIDHNLYVHNGLVYEGNYTTGLRVLDHADIANGHLVEVAFIDTHPSKDALNSYDGVWSIYPFFASGTILVGDRDEGLIVVRLLQADISVSAVAPPDPVVQGFQYNYVLDVSNGGPDEASNVTLTDVLPAGVSYQLASASQGSCTESAATVTCLLGSLAKDAVATVTVMVTADVAGVQQGKVSVGAGEIDAESANNTVVISATVLPDSDGDALDDAFEMSIGTSSVLQDTDSDGLSDYFEVAYDGDAGAYTWGQDTNPLLADTDGDLLGDAGDPLPLSFHYNDGDLAPLGSPDGFFNAADVLIANRIVIGELQAGELQLVHGDLYPPGAPDGQITLQDLLLLQQLVLN
jgi:choice-of-anchor B domain-containing protein